MVDQILANVLVIVDPTRIPTGATAS